MGEHPKGASGAWAPEAFRVVGGASGEVAIAQWIPRAGISHPTCPDPLLTQRCMGRTDQIPHV